MRLSQIHQIIGQELSCVGGRKKLFDAVKLYKDIKKNFVIHYELLFCFLGNLINYNNEQEDKVKSIQLNVLE